MKVSGRLSLHIPPILPTHIIKRMADLPEAMRLHRLHQRLEHIPALPRGLLQIPQPMPVMRLGRRRGLVFHHVPMLGLPDRRQHVA